MNGIKYGLYLLVIVGYVRGQSEPIAEPASSEPLAHEAESDPSAIEAGILLILALLVVSFYTGYILHRFHVEYLFESGGAIIWGIVIGAIIRFATTEGENTLRSVVSFNSEVFLLGLLPPIIIESGYNLKRRSFFYNLDGIIFFAFLGTAISALSYAGLVYLVIYLGWTQHSLTLSDCFLFGALISATDPVTVLSIFKMLGVNPHLYANVFGESVLNDAVAIVLYKTIAKIGDAEFTAEQFFIAFGEFAKIFFGSLGIGAGIALLMALMYKHSTLYKFPVAETSLFVLLSIASYILSEFLALSGIVAALFCGMLLDYYAFNNLSETSQRATKKIFLVLGSIAETFIFNYIGLALFAFNQEYDYALILLCIPILFISRALNVFPLSGIINGWRKKNHRISKNDQFMLWFSGLRGAIALALALSVKNPVDEPVIFTTTLMIILFTVIILGGTTIPFMKLLKIEAKALKHNPNPNIDVTEDEYNFTIENKFLRIDRKYLWPFFTRGTAHSHLPMDEKVADAAREVDDLMNPDQLGLDGAELTIEIDGRDNSASPSDSNARKSVSLNSSSRPKLSGSRSRHDNNGPNSVGKETLTSSQEIRSPYPLGVIHRSNKVKVSTSEVPPHKEWDLGNEDEKKEERELWRTAEIKFRESGGDAVRRIDFHEPSSEHQESGTVKRSGKNATESQPVEMQPIDQLKPDDLPPKVSNNINSNNLVPITSHEVGPYISGPNLNENQEVLPPSSHSNQAAPQQDVVSHTAAAEHHSESNGPSSATSVIESSDSASLLSRQAENEYLNENVPLNSDLETRSSESERKSEEKSGADAT